MTPQQQPVEAAIAEEVQLPAEAAAPPTAAVEAGPSPPDAQPALAPAPAAAAATKQEDAKRVQRRERHRAEVERKRRWEICRSLADISADVELLTQEVLPQLVLPCWPILGAPCWQCRHAPAEWHTEALESSYRKFKPAQIL